MMVGGGWGAEVHVSVYPKTLNKFNVGTAALKRQASAEMDILHMNIHEKGTKHNHQDVDSSAFFFFTADHIQQCCACAFSEIETFSDLHKIILAIDQILE